VTAEAFRGRLHTTITTSVSCSWESISLNCAHGGHRLIRQAFSRPASQPVISYRDYWYLRTNIW